MADERVIGLVLQFKGQQQALSFVNDIDKGLENVGAQLESINQQTKAVDRLGKQVEKLKKTQSQQGKQGRSAQERINEEIRETTKQYTNMRKQLTLATGDGLKNQKQLIRQLAELKQRRKEVNAEIEKERRAIEIVKAEAGSYRDLNARLVQARNTYREIGEARRNSAEGRGILQDIKELDRELKSLDADMGQYFRNVGNYVSAWDGLKTVTAQFASLFGVIAGAQEIIQTNAEISDSIADVSKTANISIESAQRLAEQLRFRDTRTSLADQLGIAEIGGQLGVAEQDLQGFTEAIDVANVALGDRFNNDASAVASTLGGLRTILQDLQTDDLSNDLLRVGNALNTLEAQGNTTAPVIADFTRRIGGVGQSLGVSASQTLGLSTALGELQVNAERGGSGIVRIFQEIAKEPEKFAEAAGIATDEFIALVNKDITEAFLTVAQNVTTNNESSTAFAKTLDDLGLSGVGVSEVFSKVGNDVDLVRSRIELAGEAIQTTTSLQDEFDKKNQTLAASIDKVRNAVINLTVNSDFQEFLAFLLENLAKLINVFAKLPGLIKENQAEFAALGAAILVLNKNLIASRLAVIKSTQAFQLLVSANARAALATRLLAAAQNALPLLAIVAGVFAIVKAFQAYNKNATAAKIATNALKDAQKEIAAATGEEISALKQAINVLKDSTASTEQRSEAIKTLQDQYPEYLNDLDIEKASVEELINLEDQLTESIIAAAAARQKQAALSDIAGQIVEAQLAIERLNRGELTRGEGFALALGGGTEDRFIEERQAEIEKLQEAYQETSDRFDAAFGLTPEKEQAAQEQTDVVVENAETQTRAAEEAAQRAVDAQRRAAEQIARLRVQGISNTFDRQAASATLNAENQIANLQGSPGQIDEQTRLITEALDRQLAEIEKKRQEARQKALDDIARFNEELVTNTLASNTDTAEGQLSALERQFTIDRTRLETELATGLVTVEQFNDRLLELEKESTAERIAVQQQLREARLAELENELLLEQQAIEQREAARIEALEGQFEQDLLTEQQFNDAREQTQEFYRQQRLEAIRLFYEEQALTIEESSIDILELEKFLADEELRIAQEKDAAILESRKRTQQADRDLLNAQYDALSAYVGGVKGLLQQDEKNRDRYGGILKALAVAEVAINLQRQLQNIALAVTQDAAKTGFIGAAFSTGVGAAKATAAILSAAFATAKILKTEFQFGGEIGAAIAAGPASDTTPAAQPTIRQQTKSGVIPRTEGRVVAQGHSQNGIRASYNGSLVELEGGEYLLRNGHETYVINKKSSRRFLSMLHRMRGNTNQFSPAKRALAESINTFNGWGDPFKYQGGGVLGDDQSTLLEAINPTISAELTPNVGPLVAPSLLPSQQSEQLTRLEALIVETRDIAVIANGRIDNLRVINDPAETVEFGNEIQTENENRGL